MRVLKFDANGQKLKKESSCDFSGIVPGTSGYLKASFSFSAEWTGMVKVAEFRKLTSDEPVSVPSLPSWERGLKCSIRDGKCIGSIVAPFVGAWIEMLNARSYTISSCVAPFVGAWIEITSL